MTVQLKGALAYARHGFAVFPLQQGAKMPLPREYRDGEPTPWVTPEGGGAELLGTTDPDRIHEMWGDQPFNVGIALRYVPCWVLDIDERSGGVDWLQDHPRLPPTLRCVTARGGENAHYWWLWDERLDGLHVTAVGAGADVKGVPGGFVIAPPSAIAPSKGHPGGSYEWDGLESWRDSEVAPAPEWLIRAMVSAGERRSHGPAPADVELSKFTLGARALELGAVRYRCAPGKWAVECPNASQHSVERARRSDSSTVLFAPPPGKTMGYLHCSHASCAEVRKWG